ncbi:MAG: hypothetical protein M0C28_47760 [Candidatus Moduliflexus flocculans]|nr:hypothetical protein [Candidatus Moduliflexus flocculans]
MTTRLRSALPPDAELRGISPVVWFDDGKLSEERLGLGRDLSAPERPGRRGAHGPGARSSSTGPRSPSAANPTAPSSCFSTACTTAPPPPSNLNKKKGPGLRKCQFSPGRAKTRSRS